MDPSYYQEQIVKVPKANESRSIKHYCRGKITYLPRQHGAEALVDKAVRMLLSKAHLLSTKLLKNVPNHYLSFIYTKAKQHECLTIHLWSTLIEAGLDPTVSHLLRLQTWYKRSVGLRLATLPVTNKATTWLTNLTLADMPVGLFDMDAISSIANLETLHIHWSQGSWETAREHLRSVPPDERVLRSWSEQARAGVAFSELRVLSLHHALDISAHTCAMLLGFPVLHVLAANRGAEASIDTFGWLLLSDHPEPQSLVRFLDHLTHLPDANASGHPLLRLELGQTDHMWWKGQIFVRDWGAYPAGAKRDSTEDVIAKAKKRKIRAGKEAGVKGLFDAFT